MFKLRMVSKLQFLLLVTLMFFPYGCKDNPVSHKIDNNDHDTAWVQCQGLPNFNITDFAASGNNLMSATYGGSHAYIFISFDNGLNWSIDTAFHVYNKSPNSQSYFGTPVTFHSFGGYLFAGVGDALRGAIYRSTDNGLTWSDNGIIWPEVDSNLTEDINCFSHIGGTLFAGTNHGVFLSTDYGSNWKAANNGFPINTSTGFPPQALRMVSEGTSLFVGGSSEYAGIFFSSNNSANWTSVNNGLTSPSLSIYGLATLGSKIFAGIFEYNANYPGGVFVTTNNGSNWNAVNNGLTDRTINILTSNDTYLFAGTNSELFVSSDGGTHWEYDSVGIPPQSMTIISLAVINSHLYVGTLHGAWRYPISMLPTVINNKKIRGSQ